MDVQHYLIKTILTTRNLFQIRQVLVAEFAIEQPKDHELSNSSFKIQFIQFRLNVPSSKGFVMKL